MMAQRIAALWLFSQDRASARTVAESFQCIARVGSSFASYLALACIRAVRLRALQSILETKRTQYESPGRSLSEQTLECHRVV